eukprot:CAMPEP_0178433160 /NCGR_PEP_ID=MMETSP0689_2-20121128/32761_1 /TAXON_ID=160604 /ORGANISM="Amphidinium massartii, Strain CS-259" /LENGTH=246 /DNA_ID=CAMNT_0020055177 /DNA_START=927 /DNA_END=1663 /DNA_ORIENTATION=-
MGKQGAKAVPAKKKTPAAPLAKDKKKKVQKSALFEKNPKNMRIGGDIRPKVDMNRFVKWPKYVRLQRKKRIMLMRLKVPPAINQFTHTMDKNQAGAFLKLAQKYKPETRKEKHARLMEAAQAKKDGGEVKSKKPVVLKFGLNHVTTLIEQKEAKLVVIAHDVDPVEMVCWMPALCRKKDVPYCIIKGKARLGTLIGKKTASCVCFTNVRKEDQHELDQLVNTMKANFNDNAEIRRKWGGGIMGLKS